VALKAAFFDVGDTLVEHWSPREVVNARARAQICAGLGERPWLDDLLEASLEPDWPASWVQAIAERAPGDPRFEPEMARQETERWYRGWFGERGIELDGIDLDRLRALMCVPLDEISTPVRGAFDAVRWCAERRLRVVLVTNTLSRGDQEVLEDWRRFGIGDAIHGVVSSHSVGWRKPHPAIFERALEIAGARSDEAFHVGDNLIADVWGAQQLGIVSVWRRPARKQPPTDERGAPTARPDRGGDTPPCRHPSQDLFLQNGDVRCAACGGAAGISVSPDATIDDLTELPEAVAPWLGARAG
jgi:putative hydrolase of the HAD superfamily